jgi:hypothetical protein
MAEDTEDDIKVMATLLNIPCMSKENSTWFVTLLDRID